MSIKSHTTEELYKERQYMNREIKFRFYHKGLNKFIDFEPKWYEGKISYNSDVIQCQQFTGLKDKNDKEIYEGDILNEIHYEDWGDESGFSYLGVVRHKTYSSCDAGHQFSGFVTYPNLNENKDYAGNQIREDCEIVGNIFENPELLKI